MKSLIKLALSLLFISLPFAVYAGWGAGLNAGYWKMDAAEFDKTKAYRAKVGYASLNTKITQGVLNPDVILFYETASRAGLSYGLSLGFGMPASVKYRETYSSWTKEEENTTTAVPALLYVKSRRGNSPYAWFGGAGGDFIAAKTALKWQNSGSSATEGVFRKNRFIPNVTAGGEYFISPNFSLGLNLKYMFSGTLKDLRGKIAGIERRLIMKGSANPSGEYVSYKTATTLLASNERLFEYDYSGPRINLALRYYFGARPAASAAGRKTDLAKPRKPAYPDDETPEEPAPVAKPADSERQKLERQKLELQKEKLKLEREKLEFEKQESENN